MPDPVWKTPEKYWQFFFSFAFLFSGFRALVPLLKIARRAFTYVMFRVEQEDCVPFF